MSEVNVRLTELRQASERLRQSAYRLQLAVDNVLPIVDQSLMDALPASENAVLYQAHKANISTMPAKITQFADNLTQAADDIASAVDNRQTGQTTVIHFYAPKRVKIGRSTNTGALLSTNVGGISTPIQGKMSLEMYVSKRNQALYDELKTTQSNLNDRSNALALLVNQRQLLMEDLTALKNRMLSFDGSVSIETHPRIESLQMQIDQLDTQIDSLQTEVHDLQVDVDQMTARLDRVAPAPGAELEAIIGLEGAENPQWMKNSTFGCVNHVVDKMPLPNGVPRDALLWDEAAKQLPQYGISWGDQPLEGSVLQLEPAHPYADDQYGHVLYVEQVDNGVVWVTDNNHPDEPVRLSDIMSKVEGDDMRYLYFPWHTKA